MNTYHLHIEGRVQGIGFRPAVFAVAAAHEVKGTVSNGTDGLHITFNAIPSTAEKFSQAVVEEAPGLAVITATHFEEVEQQEFSDFTIIDSQHHDSRSLKISPDFGICADCRFELNEPTNHRFRYAFITCTACGPRYSIMTGLPYDRPQTTMSGFEMCNNCQEEYDDPTDRRHYSQTNSCPDCGISMTLFQGQSPLLLGQEEIIKEAVIALERGDILAVKGIGGYLLLCDATCPEAIKKLRSRKNRPEKPLALMYPNLHSLTSDLKVTEAEQDQLLSPSAPIVILSHSAPADCSIAAEEVAPGFSHMGVMLPYAPLLQLIADGLAKPMVATSGNVSGSPIIFEDEQALKNLSSIADYILVHDRPIMAPQDDSVIRMVGDRPVLIRRSRGFAPAYFGEMPEQEGEKILALGAQMKGSFALATGKDWHVSQYLGSLEEYDSQLMYRQSLEHLTQLFHFEASRIITDQHPAYFSHLISTDFGLAVDYVQHHEAHFAAVLQENELIEQSEPVLGVIWDGTGWGSSEDLWGGEFFRYQNHEMTHLGQLISVAQLSGDKMAREPRVSALAFLGDHPVISKKIRGEFNEKEWDFLQKLKQRPIRKTSSMGRLFDAMASVLGLIQTSTFEGQAAMLLEEEAWKAVGQVEEAYPFRYDGNDVELIPFTEELAMDLSSNTTPATMALKFHLGLVWVIRQVAEYHGIKKLAFSGGVFQNALLVSLIEEDLGRNFQLHFHRQLSPNDENISFGQLAHFFMQQKRKEFLDQNKEAYVFSNSR